MGENGNMKKQVYDYFVDLESKALPRKNGAIIEDGDKVKRLGIVRQANSARDILKYSIAGEQFFCLPEFLLVFVFSPKNRRQSNMASSFFSINLI